MKKIIPLFLVLFLMLSLVACNKDNPETPADKIIEIPQEFPKENEETIEENEKEDLGPQNAFDEYINASQNSDSYQYLIEEMYLSLANAFATGKLGSPVAIASVHGLVPESIYSNKDTSSNKMAAIYKYSMEDKLPLYFEIEYNSKDYPISVDIKLGNMRKFIEDGIDCEVFVGSWSSFELHPQISSLEQVCQKMNITSEVAMAFFEMIDSCDVEWLDGDPGNLLNTLLEE